MITAAGEALIDIVIRASGSVTALPGGAPFNVARMVARLGGDCQFLGRLSDDGFGEQLRACLDQDGVRVAVPQLTSAPTTLATARLDESGAAEYTFYLEGTSAAQLRAGDVPADTLKGSRAIALGGLGLLIEPTASTLLGLIEHRPPTTTILLDPNCRPGAVRDLRAYRQMIDRVLRHVDIVKVSVDDLKLLRPNAGSAEAAHDLLALGPGAVLVTDGPAPVAVHTASSQRTVEVPAVDVVDTIGAGDSFVAGCLTWWTSQSPMRADVDDADALVEASRAAIEVALANCTVPGATLPEDFQWSASRSSRPKAHTAERS